jgi:four helix bundle protein
LAAAQWLNSHPQTKEQGMATVRQFEDLKVWQEARGVVREIYKVTKVRDFRHDFGLRDQITRAATSTMSNIAEGFERGSRKEFIQFLTIAKGSSGEVRSQLCVALDQEYLDEAAFTELKQRCIELSRRIAAFVRYLEAFPSNDRVQKAARRT